MTTSAERNELRKKVKCNHLAGLLDEPVVKTVKPSRCNHRSRSGVTPSRAGLKPSRRRDGQASTPASPALVRLKPFCCRSLKSHGAEMMSPTAALRHQSQTRPDQVAFVAGPKTWTYRDLAIKAAHLAQVLHARGIRPGDRIALHMTNVPELVVIYYACFQTGAIPAPLNVRFKTAELRPLLRRLQPALYSLRRSLRTTRFRNDCRPSARFRGMPWARLTERRCQPWCPKWPNLRDNFVVSLRNGSDQGGSSRCRPGRPL